MSKATRNLIEAHAALTAAITAALAAASEAGLTAADCLAALAPIQAHLEGEDS